ncbi:MAG: hypothetical protein CV081_05400 [Nitrospira sp. LK265]|nr:hypothetical protein [Nitrospira sp. LK265]
MGDPLRSSSSSKLLPVRFRFDDHFLCRFVMLIGHGSTAHAASSTLATPRGSDFDALLAHVLQQQVNGANGNYQDHKGDDDGEHGGDQGKFREFDMLPLPYFLAQGLLVSMLI